jgi:hypothetical protein
VDIPLGEFIRLRSSSYDGTRRMGVDFAMLFTLRDLPDGDLRSIRSAKLCLAHLDNVIIEDR